MNEMPSKLQARAQRKTAKRDEKKRRIAESAIEALKELGYANTSLRDIAAHSDQSLGMLHYYFEDRAELIIYCVEIYKEQFVNDLFQALEGVSGRDQVVEAFSEALVTSIIDDEMTHRLWYDIRNQALFDVAFRPVVAEIEAKLIGIVQLAFEKAGKDPVGDVAIHYALLDGVFRQMMQHQIMGHPMPRRDLKSVFGALLAQFL
ncbi:TetR/AcrR family transcriptional regulator [Shimia litoralis]|uniref:TetR/AcrR family transcriptional regulator n=1 Tax=Shimia litoralis TaxID=420403 RepID=A0A4U7MY55_9RHOB|nr:TetR/AcrR family transcriptional regulator [Shimia litoralis]TKZ18162.1 TetR/AcrR family transcriptional regulator [Shimia litoralis]